MRIIEFLRFKSIWWAAALILIALAGLFVLRPTKTHAENERVITIYHDGAEQTVVTDAPNVEDVLKRTGINLGKNDFVEPALDTAFEAPAYNINIYRARPILVEDGAKKYQISSPHSSPQKIAEAAGLKLHDEDLVELSRSDDLLSDGVGLKLTIQRATHVVLVLYGTQKDVYTQSATVGGFLNEKGIKFGAQDGMNVSLQTPIESGIKLEVWRDGVQTVTEEQEIKFPTELIRDTSKDVGFKEVKEPGTNGKKLVTYEIELRNGKELARKEIQSVTTEEPKKQVEVVGAKPNGKADVGANQALGHSMMLAYGFGEDQWPCLLDLWNRESGWNQYKANYQGSGAYGIPQALPGSKMGAGWETDAAVQIQWGLGYIKGRYVNPCGALNAFMSRSPHWY